MKIEQLDHVHDKEKETTKSTILVDGVEHVIMVYLDEDRETVFRNGVEVFPPLADEIIKADEEQLRKDMAIYDEWDESEDDAFLNSLK